MGLPAAYSFYGESAPRLDGFFVPESVMPPTTPCPSADDLQRYSLGEALEEEADLLGRHLSECCGCLHVLQTLRLEDPLVAALRDHPGFPPDPVLEVLMAKWKRLLTSALLTPGASA
jgi:hypothetical protein